MNTVTILRRLWRFKLFVVIVALVAVLAGIAVGYSLKPPFSLESRKYTVGVATARILVDTPESQVVDVAPKGSDSTGARANLIATLMVDGEIKRLIAKRAGLNPERLLGLSQAAADPAAVATEPTRRDYVLSTRVTTIANGTWLPIIEINTQAPDAVAAQRIADAAVTGVREFLDTKAAEDAVPDANRLKVSGLGVAVAETSTRGPRLVFSLAAMVFIFLAGCAGIIVVSNIVRALRAPETSSWPVRRTNGRAPRAEEPAWEVEDPDDAFAPESRAPRTASTPVPHPPASAPELPAAEPAHPPARSGGWWGDPS